MSTNPLVGLHYQLLAYVCGAACTKPSPFEGWATFTQIFNSRPDGCRFAVARIIPLHRNPNPDPNTPLVSSGEPTGPFVVWDLYDKELVSGKRVGASGSIAPPPALWLSDSSDGLIMKAMALYDRDVDDARKPKHKR